MLKTFSIGLSSLVIACLFCAASAAEDGGKVSGAIWKYEMSQVSARGQARTGAFRIDGTDIYQPRDKKPTKIGAIAGKKNQVPKKGDKVTVDFDALRGSDEKELKCKGAITWNSLGEVEGRLIDGDGVHWNFKASRVQE